MVGRSGPRLIAAALGLLLCLAAGAVLSAQRGGGAAAAPDPVAPPAPTIALTGARVFDGTGAAPADGMTILMVKGRIQAVGPDGTVRLPADATRVDMSGKTVMPGLINAHGHLDAGDEKEPLYDRINKQLQTYA
jgi:imidazolonepropionase-like amidohydrolase